MAYRRKAHRRAATVRHYARRASRVALGGPVSLLSMAFSFGYGYARGYITSNSMFQTLVAWMPFGDGYKDNLVLGGLAYAVSWLLRPTNAYLKEALATIVRSEAFIAGAKMSAGYSLTGSSSASYSGVTLN